MRYALMLPIVINCYIYCTLFPLTYLKWFIIIIDLASLSLILINDLRKSDFRYQIIPSIIIVIVKVKMLEKN